MVTEKYFLLVDNSSGEKNDVYLMRSNGINKILIAPHGINLLTINLNELLHKKNFAAFEQGVVLKTANVNIIR